MKEWADLLSAIGHLLWPLVALTGLLIFRVQLQDVLGRIKKGKLLGQEIELHERLVHLQASAKAVVAALPPASPENQKQISDVQDERSHVIAEAGRSPKAALLLLASQVERELLRVLAGLGLWKDEHPPTFQQGLLLLESTPGYARTLGDSVRLFYDVRNRLIHGRSAGDDEVLSALDSGLTILEALNAIPRTRHIVYEVNVPLFEDRACRNIRAEVTGVMLENVSADLTQKAISIFPTTRKHFKKGQLVTWEWNMNLVTDESWYRDPITKDAKLAWSQAAEFIGRDIESL